MRVIHEGRELPALPLEPEVARGQEERQKFSVKRTAPPLIAVQLPAEESQAPPSPAHPALTHGTYRKT